MEVSQSLGRLLLKRRRPPTSTYLQSKCFGRTTSFHSNAIDSTCSSTTTTLNTSTLNANNAKICNLLGRNMDMIVANQIHSLGRLNGQNSFFVRDLSSKTVSAQHMNQHMNQQIMHQQTKLFSSSNNRRNSGGSRGGKGGRKGSGNQKQDQHMINEHLITMLLRVSTQTADSLQVRLLIDQPRKGKKSEGSNTTEEEDADDDTDDDTDSTESTENNSKSKQSTSNDSDVQLVSLAQAISIATDMGVDLVGISLQQSIPVIRAIDYSKFLFQSSKATKQKKSSILKQTKAKKEYSFRAGIDPHDLERKTKNMVSYLQKGYSCQVTITSNRRNLRNDQDAIMTTLNRVEEYVGEYGNPGKMKKNAYGNRGSILFQPKSKK